MKAVYDFIIEPVGERYTNTKKSKDGDLILNTEMQNHNYSNRVAKVLAVPSEIKTDIIVGDEVIVHHNVFRRFRDIRGIEKIVDHTIKMMFFLRLMSRFTQLKLVAGGELAKVIIL